ncbi:hypothetical protein RhiJN_18654 [Ceratobasidium sp. AG-Ba]|nr:hypothetical protein RhiJN_18654 [Ceratobasidium sp. AG-Ba]
MIRTALYSVILAALFTLVSCECPQLGTYLVRNTQTQKYIYANAQSDLVSTALRSNALNYQWRIQGVGLFPFCLVQNLQTNQYLGYTAATKDGDYLRTSTKQSAFNFTRTPNVNEFQFFLVQNQAESLVMGEQESLRQVRAEKYEKGDNLQCWILEKVV